ncbi:MAG: triose-phosphate isomerase [Alphaproteobacteria bacterium]
MAGTRRPLIAANWKMNGLRGDSLARVAAVIDRARASTAPLRADVVICPPATLLWALRDALQGSDIALGAQDCHAKPSGAHTGDIAAPMLVEAGCRYVIVGHSERRAGHGESDAAVRAKAEAAHAAGLTAIICVGESEEERKAGRAVEIVTRQTVESLPDGATPANTVVAYEPIWAIGSGQTPTTVEIAEAHAAIRRALGAERKDGDGIRILYGGSVKAANAKPILALPLVEGALVGGASLDAREFWAIVESCP